MHKFWIEPDEYGNFIQKILGKDTYNSDVLEV